MLSFFYVSLFFNAFIARNSLQILAKARFFGVQPDEIKSTLFILISERLHKFDRNRASAEAYFFGCLHAHFARFSIDVNACAMSLDEDSEEGVAFKSHVEHWVSTQQQSKYCFTHTNGRRIAAGEANLLSLAEAASGNSVNDIANVLGISPRRVNQIRKEKEEEAKKQFGLDFSGDENDE